MKSEKEKAAPKYPECALAQRGMCPIVRRLEAMLNDK